jgi:hypothetical protein
MSVDDLPLFAWRPKEKVLAFPPARRARLVRITAVRLLTEEDGEAQAEAMETVGRDLSAAGLSDAEAWPYLWDLHKAIQAEIARLAGWDKPHRGQR